MRLFLFVFCVLLYAFFEMVLLLTEMQSFSEVLAKSFNCDE